MVESPMNKSDRLTKVRSCRKSDIEQSLSRAPSTVNIAICGTWLILVKDEDNVLGGGLFHEAVVCFGNVFIHQHGHAIFPVGTAVASILFGRQKELGCDGE